MPSIFHSFRSTVAPEGATFFKLGRWIKRERISSNIRDQLRQRKFLLQVKNQQRMDSKGTSTMAIQTIRNLFYDFIAKHSKILRLLAYQFHNFKTNKLYDKDQLYRRQWNVYLTEARLLVYDCEMALAGHYHEKILCAMSNDYKSIVSTLIAINGKNWRNTMPPYRRRYNKYWSKRIRKRGRIKQHIIPVKRSLQNWRTGNKYTVPLRRSYYTYPVTRRFSVQSPKSSSDSSSDE